MNREAGAGKGERAVPALCLATAAAAIPLSNNVFQSNPRRPNARCWLVFVDGHAVFLPIHSPGTNLTTVVRPPGLPRAPGPAGP